MIKIYMIKQGQLEEIQKPIFTTGDAYVVVDNQAKEVASGIMVYIWLGSKCSVDEKGTAAVEARRIDDSEFQGNAKIVTYDEGMEAPEFLAKLGGLKILDKNLAKSMFKDVKTGEWAGEADHVNALYRISSEEVGGDINAIKYLQVPFEKKSLDNEDTFIADIGVDIFVWIGSKSNSKEKAKAISIARNFDADRAGCQRPVVFEEGDDAKFMEIFEPGFKAKSESKVQDFKAEVFDETPAAKPAEPTPAPKAVEVPKPAAPAPKASTPTPKAAEPAPKAAAPAPKAAAPAPKAAAPVAPAKEMPKGGSGEVLIQKGGGRVQCPKCGNNQRNMIRESEDRGQVMDTYLGLYGKKFHCGKCGTVWKREEE